MSDANPTPDPTTPDPVTPDTGDTDWQAEAEKWKANSRKHEERAKTNAKAAGELEELKTKSLSDQEKAVAAARKEGEAEATKKALTRLARAELKAAAKGVFPDGVIAKFDVSEFITADGDIDDDAIAQFVKDNTPEPNDDDGKPSPIDFGQGKRTPAPTAADDPLLAEIKQKVG